ncbi:MAG: choice-of-anchor D domain-containing protein, partial [Myxococcota bacterium]
VRLEPGSDQEFSIPDGDIQSELIPPDTSLAVTVQFQPSEGRSFTGTVEFSISNPSTPFNRVGLTGSGAEETLLIVPPELDFGVIGVGCAARSRTVQIYNTGSGPATIDGVNLVQSGEAFSLTRTPNLPQEVTGGRTVEFDIGFRADTQSDFTGAVEVFANFNGVPQTYIVSLKGRGDDDALQVDSFSQLGVPAVDILFVIDHTGSMQAEQEAIANNFRSFIQFAQAQAIDYQLGVTTTDTNTEMGRLCPLTGPPENRVVTPNTQPDPETVFADNVTCRALSGGVAADEAGFEAAFQALSAPVIFGHNLGFLRRDAVLSLIFVSDEQEQSGRSLDFYLSFFQAIKGFRNTNLFSVSSISAPEDSDCSGPGGNTLPSGAGAPRYVEMARRTGGVWQEICTSDWSRTLEELSTTAFGFKSRFFLRNQPVIPTIKVIVDGVNVLGTGQGGTVNWTYDFGTNSVNFSPFSTPEPGAEIRVEYAAECL